MKIRIRELLHERNMTTAQLAQMAGVNQTTINTIINRESCSLDTLCRYATLINVPIWELLWDCGVSAIGHEPDDDSWRNATVTSLRIEQLMYEKRMNKAQLARAMGVTGAAVTMMMKRTSNNTAMTVVEKLTNAFSIPVYQLFISEDEYLQEIARRKGISTQEAALEKKKNSMISIMQNITDATDVFNDGELHFPEDDEGQTLAMLTDGEYRYGNLVLVLNNGRVTIK